MQYSFSTILLMMFLSSCGQEHVSGINEDEKQYPFTNQLANESSPYLLQHAHNPVNWYPWGEEALAKAKAENKMLIISVGYSACHWCHVMEHESFEDTLVAQLMNKHFIAIKVDREERPDVDQIYMTAAQLITGKGGWPLNALALPDGRPFYAGTYFQKNNWMKVLEYFVDMQSKNPASILEQAEQVTQGIRSTENVPLSTETALSSKKDLDNGFDAWKKNADPIKGGGNQAPKFPMPCMWNYLLQYGASHHNDEAISLVEATLDNMAYGGIYDHIGGGFARYSTDVNWHVPHFEKMLYDNGQLVSLYSHAWQKTKNPKYEDVVHGILAFVNREMTSKEGGFFSSKDADSEGEEGKFYVWSKSEIMELLGEESKLFEDFYQVTKIGNWEHGKNILYTKESIKRYAERKNRDVSEVRKSLNASRSILMTKRETRIKPALDDKILTAWNGLMMRGYVDAYRAFGNKEYLQKAIDNANFVLNQAKNKEGGLNRNYKNSLSTVPGFLDDYAFTISAFIDLYQATFEEKWLAEALELSEYAINHFFDKKSGMFFYTNRNHANLIARKMEVADNVIPSSNSEMAKNLLYLGHYYYNQSYVNKARQLYLNVKNDIQKNLYFYANWASVEAHFTQPLFEVAIVGKNWKEKRAELDKNYLPNVLIMGGKNEGTLQLLEGKYMKGNTMIYVCQDKACKMPETEVSKVLEQLH